MRRRALLGALGTSVTAGCLGTIVQLPGGGSRFSVENDAVPDGFPATLSAELLTEATANHPPRIRVEFEYTGNEARTVRFSYPGPFADTVGVAADGSKLVLKYEANADSYRDGCWQGASYGSGATEHRRFDPGEKTRVEWSVLTPESVDSCYPAGDYRFEDEYFVDDTRFEWGFDLRVR